MNNNLKKRNFLAINALLKFCQSVIFLKNWLYLCLPIKTHGERKSYHRKKSGTTAVN